MRGQGGPFGLMMIFIAFLVIGMAVFYLYSVAIVPQIKQGAGQLAQVTSGRIGMLRSLIGACDAWRAPQSFYDPAALSSGMIEAINRLFPGMGCSQDAPLACEQVCACTYKLEKYCHIGDPGSSAGACAAEPCRVVVEG